MPLKIYQEDKLTEPKISHILAIAAGKGGVGKSTVAVHLAHALKRLGYAVGVMDTDIYGPSIRKMLPEDTPPAQQGQRIIPALSYGIKVISMAHFRKENEAAVVRAPIANGIIMQFIKNIEWGPLDFLLIDFPPGTGDIQLTLSQQAHLSGAVMVTTPQQVATLDVRKAMHMFDQVQVPILGIVENMSFYRYPKTDEVLYLFGKGGGENLARETGVPYLGAIPIDPELCQSCDRGTSLFSEGKKDLPISVSFTEIAQRVIDQTSAIKLQSQECMQNFELLWKEMNS
jgi:ATP-binding protein involved in chromosome partitioning